MLTWLYVIAGSEATKQSTLRAAIYGWMTQRQSDPQHPPGPLGRLGASRLRPVECEKKLHENKT